MLRTGTTTTEYEREPTTQEKVAKLAAEIEEMFDLEGFTATTVNVECYDRILSDGARRLSATIYVEHPSKGA